MESTDEQWEDILEEVTIASQALKPTPTIGAANKSTYLDCEEWRMEFERDGEEMDSRNQPVPKFVAKKLKPLRQSVMLEEHIVDILNGDACPGNPIMYFPKKS